MFHRKKGSKKKGNTSNLSVETFSSKSKITRKKRKEKADKTTNEEVEKTTKTVTCEEPDKKDEVIHADKDKGVSKFEAAPTEPVYQLAVKEAEKDLATASWYHGLMPREEIEALLDREGDFLVRRTDVAGSIHYALSINGKGKCHHVLFKVDPEGQWFINNAKKAPKIGDLVEHYLKTKDDGGLIAGYRLITTISRPEWYVLHDNVKLTKKLGEGNFGEVHLGELLLQNNQTVKVAVKTLKGKLKKRDRANFVKEASMMRKFKHPNIVRILGVASQTEPVMIILELASGGCLKSHVKENPDLPIEHLQRYALEAAQGMEYLADNNVIHRDIAARNCLLNANDQVKISDFGLSVANKSQVTEVKLKSMPIKWLAPETLLNGVFNHKTDIWSFGIMLWEIFYRCKKDPYPGMSNMDARKAIISDLRMNVPDGTPDAVATLMSSCWKFKPEDRPDFKEIVKRLGGKPATEAPVLDDKEMQLPCYFAL